jgi:hypothetical protein
MQVLCIYRPEREEGVDMIMSIMYGYHNKEIMKYLMIKKTINIQGFSLIVGVLIALIAIHGDTVFGQANQTTVKLSTIECVPYSGTHLIVVVIDHKENLIVKKN